MCERNSAPAYLPVSESVSQSISQSVGQSISQSINQSISQSVINPSWGGAPLSNCMPPPREIRILNFGFCTKFLQIPVSRPKETHRERNEKEWKRTPGNQGVGMEGTQRPSGSGISRRGRDMRGRGPEVKPTPTPRRGTPTPRGDSYPSGGLLPLWGGSYPSVGVVRDPPPL